MIPVSTEAWLKAMKEHLAAHTAWLNVPRDCKHEPVQTGMQKSWCKHCDVNMRMKDGTYQVEEAA